MKARTRIGKAVVRAASKKSDWGQIYGGPVAYILPDGRKVVMRRKRQAVRFFNIETGRQIGPEQSNVAPAIAYAMYHRWRDPDIPEWMQEAGTREVRQGTTSAARFIMGRTRLR